VRCGRCGNENDESNRFCGMCGASLVATTQTGRQKPAAGPTGSGAVPRQTAGSVQAPVQSAPRQTAEAPVPEPAGLSSPTAERRPAPLLPTGARSSTGPVITGHSFLGLNNPGPAVDRHDDGDPLRPSSNLDYLLDDEEEEPKRGGGKMLLMVVALALAGGLGYLHFKQTGFGGLPGFDKKPATAKPAADATPGTDSGVAAGSPSAESAVPATGTSGAGTTPAPGGAAASPGDSAPGTATPATALPITPQSTPPPSATSQTVPAQAQSSDPNLPAVAVPPPASSGPDKNTPPEPAPERKAVTRKPPAAVKAVDPVTYAERYIYGRGVSQDCDHGLRLLKPAAEQSNAKAMISLGALYSTGTCTPRDLPTAYRWFALALHQEPDNQALQDDLQKLWSQMTQPERQLAIKLSQ
jgi:zinc-ribbon domain